jgi:hypothetical protein
MYGDMGMQDNEPAQDMYGAGYYVNDQPQEYQEVSEGDPYAGIDIDLTKIQKVETKKADTKEPSEEQSMQSSKKSEEESVSHKSEEKKVIVLDKELEDESETEVNRARVEDELAKDSENSH